MDDSEYRPTGAEIDDARLFGENSIMGPWTASCWLGLMFMIVFFVGFLLGFVAKALMF